MPSPADPETGPGPLSSAPVVVRYLADSGFRLDYQADGVAVYRPA